MLARLDAFIFQPWASDFAYTNDQVDGLTFAADMGHGRRARILRHRRLAGFGARSHRPGREQSLLAGRYHIERQARRRSRDRHRQTRGGFAPAYFWATRGGG